VLVRDVGPTLLVGHSFGAAIAAKVMEVASKQVTGLISIAPAPHGNIANNRPPLPGDQAVVFGEDAMRRFFCNAPNFPKESIDNYRRSLCSMSPGVFNATASSNGSRSFVIDDFASVASIPKMVVAGDNDQLVTDHMSSTVAESLGAQHITVGKDWGLPGFGHMMPIENGSEEILKTVPRLVCRQAAVSTDVIGSKRAHYYSICSTVSLRTETLQSIAISDNLGFVAHPGGASFGASLTRDSC
jgi:predicted alpha/beta hydrolase family esterase